MSVCSSKKSAISSSTSKSSAICLRISGRCTFTTTGRPSRKAARCTCPSDAAARCFSSKNENARDNLVHFGVRKRLDLVLQTRERLQIRFRQKVGAGGKQLAEFDEGRPHFFQIVGQLFRRGLAGFGGQRCLVTAGGLTGKFPGQIGMAVFPKKQRDVLVALEVMRF